MSRPGSADRPPVADRLQELGAASLGENPSPEAVEGVLRRWIATLNGADPLRVQLERDALAALPGVTAASVDAALASQGPGPDPDDVQGETLAMEDPEPWPDDVDGAELLSGLVRTVDRYLALPAGAAPAAALWVLHAHAHDASPVSPVLAITSPEKRCGKTTFLELLSALVPRPLPASNLTAATVFRAVEQYRPTLLVDEADTFLKRGSELRGVLNSGHRRSLAYVPRCVGDDHEVRRFRTWAPKAVALIGELPDTLSDRSVEVRMRRRAPDEQVDRLRLDRLPELEPLRRKAWTWARRHEDELAGADPDLPDGLHDRQRDNWRPLVALADLAGGPWPDRARKAARVLTSDGRDDRSLGTRLLADVRDILQDHPSDTIRSKRLVDRLTALEEAPWSEYKGRGLSAVSLAHFLRSFDISSKNVRTDAGVYKGYTRDAFEDAFRRYLDTLSPADPPGEGATTLQGRKHKGSDGNPGRYTEDDVAGRESPENPDVDYNVAGVAGRKGDPHEGDPDDLPELPF